VLYSLTQTIVLTRRIDVTGPTRRRQIVA